MGKYGFAKSSVTRMKSIDPKLCALLYEVKERSEIDFDISCGYRSIEDQEMMFKTGRSQLDGVNNKSMHNFFPALAVDIYAYKHGGKADYSKKKMLYLAQVFKEAATDMKIKIVWGGDWPDFVDMPHYQLA